MEEAGDKLIPISFVGDFINPISQQPESIDVDGVGILE
jgi:hypothetical protein